MILADFFIKVMNMKIPAEIYNNPISPPFQPDFENYLFYNIHALETDSALSGIICDCYQFTTDAPENFFARILPDACIYLVFELNPDTIKPIIFTCVQFIKHISLKTHTEYFFMRFFPGVICNYFNCHIDDVLNRPVPLDEVMPKNEYEQLLEELRICNTFEHRVAIINRFIKYKHGQVKDFKNILLYARNRILNSGGTINIDTLSKEMNYSQRYLRILFQNYIGISPKTFCEIVKFQKSFTISCLLINKYSLSDIAALCGYYDHPQMNRAYLNLVEKSPLTLRHIFFAKNLRCKSP